ncbi:MAG: hypothetical protein V4726_02580 [Verrucomicrobiota bacterium]
MAATGKTRLILTGTLWLASLGGAYLLGTLRNSAGAAGAPSGTGGVVLVEPSGFSPRGESGTASASRSLDSVSTSSSARGGSVAARASGSSGKFESRLSTLRAGKSSPERERALRELIADWAARDPAAALAAADAEPGLKLRADLRATALTHWAQADPEKAWAFAIENPGGELPDNRFDLVMDGIGRGNPQTALKFLEDHSGDMGGRLERAAGVVEDLFENGNQEALVSWAEKLPDGKLKDAAQTRLIDRWARYDPEAAMTWMNAHVTDPQALSSARGELAESWARVSPDAALKWVDSLPADQRSPAFYNRIYSRWMDYDRNAAGAALAAQPASPKLDKPIERYTYEVMRENPADTMPWAESIGDQDRRWRAVERVAEEWRRRDPEGLRNYVAGSGFSGEQKSKLLGLPPPDQKSGVPAARGGR